MYIIIYLIGKKKILIRTCAHSNHVKTTTEIIPTFYKYTRILPCAPRISVSVIKITSSRHTIIFLSLPHFIDMHSITQSD